MLLCHTVEFTLLFSVNAKFLKSATYSLYLFCYILIKLFFIELKLRVMPILAYLLCLLLQSLKDLSDLHTDVFQIL